MIALHSSPPHPPRGHPGSRIRRQGRHLVPRYHCHWGCWGGLIITTGLGSEWIPIVLVSIITSTYDGETSVIVWILERLSPNTGPPSSCQHSSHACYLQNPLQPSSHLCQTWWLFWGGWAVFEDLTRISKHCTHSISKYLNHADSLGFQGLHQDLPCQEPWWPPKVSLFWKGIPLLFIVVGTLKTKDNLFNPNSAEDLMSHPFIVNSPGEAIFADMIESALTHYAEHGRCVGGVVWDIWLRSWRSCNSPSISLQSVMYFSYFEYGFSVCRFRLFFILLFVSFYLHPLTLQGIWWGRRWWWLRQQSRVWWSLWLGQFLIYIYFYFIFFLLFFFFFPRSLLIMCIY